PLGGEGPAGPPGPPSGGFVSGDRGGTSRPPPPGLQPNRHACIVEEERREGPARKDEIVGKHREPKAPRGYQGKHTEKARAEAQKPGGFRVGDPERFQRLDRGKGDWFTER